MIGRTVTLEQIGGIALEWQKAVRATKLARLEYYDKYRQCAGGEHIKVGQPGWEAVASATRAEWLAFERAKADEYNARRRLERATRRCEQ